MAKGPFPRIFALKTVPNAPIPIIPSVKPSVDSLNSMYENRKIPLLISDTVHFEPWGKLEGVV